LWLSGALPDFVNYHYRMTPEEARQAAVDGINYAAYKETDSSLYDSDKNRLFGSEHYRSDRVVVKPSPWAEGDFEGKMAVLLRWANALNSPDPAFAEAQSHLEGEDSVIGRVIRRSKTSDLPSLEPQEKELPRWIRVPAGLVLGLFTLLCGFASLALLLVPNKQAPVLAIIVGLVLILGCLWILEKCFRLITGRKNRGGLMSPNTLRVLSFFFADPPDHRLIHWLLSGDGCYRDISSGDVLFRVSGASCVSSETRGRGRLRRPSQRVVDLISP
jgi:hypothetical protein